VTTETTYATDVVTDEQWDAIDRRLDGGLVDDSARRAARRGRRPWFLAAAVVVAGGIAVGWFVEYLLPLGPADDIDDLQTVVAAALIAIAVEMWTTGTVVLVRTGGVALLAQEPTTGLPRDVRRVLARAVTDRGPIDRAHRRTLRRVAVLRLEQGTWASWFVGGFVPLGIAQALLAWSPWTAWAYLVFVAFFLAGVAAGLRRRRHWRAFLAAHPDATGEHHAHAVGR
jgi:hypothetical protein